MTDADRFCGSRAHRGQNIPATATGLGCIPVCAACKAAQGPGVPYPTNRAPYREPRGDESFVRGFNAGRDQ